MLTKILCKLLVQRQYNVLRSLGVSSLDVSIGQSLFVGLEMYHL